jgi:uncharacterized membrane protein
MPMLLDALVDQAYGMLAGAVILSGIARVVYSPKTAAYFVHNPARGFR